VVSFVPAQKSYYDIYHSSARALPSISFRWYNFAMAKGEALFKDLMTVIKAEPLLQLMSDIHLSYHLIVRN
jgi:hypothetical protein